MHTSLYNHPTIENVYIAYPVAVVAGFVLTTIVVSAIEALGRAISPPPKDLDFQDTEALREFVQQASALQLVWVPLAYLAGPFAGTLLAAWIVQKSYWVLAAVIGLPMLRVGIQMVKKYPGPAWFNFCAIVASPLGVSAAALLAIRLFA